MASPKFTAGRRNIDALVALAAKQPPPAVSAEEPRGAQRAGSELGGNMTGDYPTPWPQTEPSLLVRYSEKRF